MTKVRGIQPRVLGDPATHVTVRIEPLRHFLGGEDEMIWAAIERLPIPADRRADAWNRADDFIDRIRNAGLSAGIRSAPKGERGTPGDILTAASDIARGLDMIERGLGKIDGARRSTAIEATARSAALRRVHEDILRSIAAAASSALPTAIIRDVDIDASVPSYTPMGFANPWRGTFSRAAGQVDAIVRGVAADELRSPKPRDEWFGRLVWILARIYEDLTGTRAKAYARGQVVNAEWRPPFCEFVTDLWPLWRLDPTTPSDSKIRDALAKTTKLLGDSTPR